MDTKIKIKIYYNNITINLKKSFWKQIVKFVSPGTVQI